ncbi:MAG: lysozyme [Parvularculaceae bacterium]|nr:lysozyme [Parvularculaceae bacterium]
MMTNPPLIVISVLVLALSVLSLTRGPAPSSPDAPRVTFFRELLPLGPERFPPLPPAPDARHGANAWLAINERGLDVIRKSEGLRLQSYYLAGQWLIGYGHAGGARQGMTITADEADDLLIEDVKNAEDAVRRLVAVPINENEFSALVSLAYNMGPGGFAGTEVLRRLNAGDRQGAADAFRHIIAADINGERKVLAALKRRRAAERALFLAPPLRV